MELGFYDRNGPVGDLSFKLVLASLRVRFRVAFAVCVFRHVAIWAVLELSSRVASSVRHVQLQTNFCVHIPLRLHPDRCFAVCQVYAELLVSHDLSFIPSIKTRRRLQSRLQKVTSFSSSYVDCLAWTDAISEQLDSEDRPFTGSSVGILWDIQIWYVKPALWFGFICYVNNLIDFLSLTIIFVFTMMISLTPLFN